MSLFSTLLIVSVISGLTADANGGSFIDGAFAGALIFTIGYFTGGAVASAGGSSFLSSLAGGITGGITGGFFHNTLGLESFEAGFVYGFWIGYSAGRQGYKDFASKGRSIAGGKEYADETKKARKRVSRVEKFLTYIRKGVLCAWAPDRCGEDPKDLEYLEE